MKTKVLKLDKPKREWVETYQELNILNQTTGHVDLWHEHYPFKKWITHKYFAIYEREDPKQMEFNNCIAHYKLNE